MVVQRWDDAFVPFRDIQYTVVVMGDEVFGKRSCETRHSQFRYEYVYARQGAARTLSLIIEQR
jgi:hypothetical protein